MGSKSITAQGRRSPHMARLAAVVGCAAMLAGCNTTREVTGGTSLDYRQRHPIVIKEGTRTVELFIGSKRSTLTPAQRADANAVISELSREKLWSQPIVTEIADAAPFYRAETYHQEYFERNGRQPYCQFVVAPKVAKFRKQYFDRLKRQ